MLADMAIGFFTCLLMISFAVRQWPWVFYMILDEQELHKDFMRDLKDSE